MEIGKKNSTEIIDFLKTKSRESNEVNKFRKSGVYFISEKSMISSQTNIEKDISLDYFYKQFDLQERKKMSQLLYEKQDNNSPNEFIYRYKGNEQLIWIKEYGIFSYKNKNKRMTLIVNISKQVDQNHRLYRLAYYDSITQLKNRNYFDQDIQFLMSYHVPFSLFLMDLNRLKINDNYSRLWSNHLLKQFSERIQNHLESIYDFDLYRLSDDEFGIILPYLTKIKDTDKVIKVIFELLKVPFYHDAYQIALTPSIGIAFYPKDSKSKATLLKYADISMYRAKNDSYLNYSYFDNHYFKLLLDEKRIEDHIKTMINEGLVNLRFQPIYDVAKMKIVSLEALVYDTEYPIEKIFDIALKSQLITLFEKKIIEKIFCVINTHRKMIPLQVRFNINITPKTIENCDIYNEIRALLIKYNIKGEWISIEITEQYFIKDEHKLNLLINQLQTLGITIYLDDFGMGFSSVRNLTYLNYNHIKLDKRLAASILNNEKCQLFIKSIFQFTSGIGSDVIVEGVETKQQLEYLQMLGAIYIQGYYLSKPVGITEVIALMQR